MRDETDAKIKLKLGSFEMEFKGTSDFLGSEVPKLIQAARELHASGVAVSLGELNNGLSQSLTMQDELEKSVEDVKTEIHSLSELSEATQLKLQMAMDRISKMASLLSNIAKKNHETAQQIINNIK